MSIIDSFPFSAIVRDPFADWLTVTFPKGFEALNKDGPSEFDAALLDGVEAILGQLGAVGRLPDGTYIVGRIMAGGQLESYGSVKFKSKGAGFFMVSTSGGLLDRMRDCGLFMDYLALLGSFPHRVTRLHASCDYAVPSPGAAVRAVKALASAGEVQLSRKALPASQCKFYLKPGDDGLDTGTVYLGEQKKSDITAKVYDKQRERLDRGFADPGPIVRVELSLGSETGVTLRDAADPSGVFWHYAGKMLVEAPQGRPEWSGNAEGFTLPPRRVVGPLERMQRLLEASFELRQLVDLACAAHGDHAAAVLARIFRERCEVKLAGV